MDSGEYVNNAGKFAVPPTFPGSDEGGNKLVTVTQHSEGLAAVSKADKWGFINLLGNMTIEPQFDSAMSFSEGLAGVYEGDKLGYIDHGGRFVIEPKFANGTSFSEGRDGVEIDRLWGFIDISGREVIHPRFQSCSGFSEGLALTQDNPDSTMQGSFGFIDGAGNWAIQPTGDPWWFSDFHSGWARYSPESEQFDLKLGFINHSARL